MIKYQTDRSNIQGMINYRLMAGDRALETHHGAWCFATIFNGAIPKTCTSVEIYHPPAHIPYSNESIERWIAAINKLGFPCTVSFEKDMVRFFTPTEKYKYKLHILSTMMLIR